MKNIYEDVNYEQRSKLTNSLKKKRSIDTFVLNLDSQINSKNMIKKAEDITNSYFHNRVINSDQKLYESEINEKRLKREKELENLKFVKMQIEQKRKRKSKIKIKIDDYYNDRAYKLKNK